jgi:hypothetical protein
VGVDSPTLSEVANEDNLNALNDIYHQNEFNLESYLTQIQELKEQEEVSSREEGEGESETGENELRQSKRVELKYISGEQQMLTSDRSLRDQNLSINKTRLNKKKGGCLRESN